MTGGVECVQEVLMPYLKEVKQLVGTPASCWGCHCQVWGDFVERVSVLRRNTNMYRASVNSMKTGSWLWVLGEDLTLEGVLTPKLRAGRKAMCSVRQIKDRNSQGLRGGTLFCYFGKSHNLLVFPLGYNQRWYFLHLFSSTQQPFVKYHLALDGTKTSF